MALATIAAIGIHNAKAYQQLIHDISALRDINASITKGISRLSSAHRTAVKELTSRAYGTLWLVDAGGKPIGSGRDLRA